MSMRSAALNLVVAFALFGVALANSDRQHVVDTYRAYVQAIADRDASEVCRITRSDASASGESARSAVADCVTYYERDGGNSAENARRWQPLLDARVVDVDVDGDWASATLRAGGCTLPILDVECHRGDDGHWRLAGRVVEDADRLPVCEEGDKIPPAALAWTWQGRDWADGLPKSVRVSASESIAAAQQR